MTPEETRRLLNDAVMCMQGIDPESRDAGTVFDALGLTELDSGTFMEWKQQQSAREWSNREAFALAMFLVGWYARERAGDDPRRN